ncbi:hypothetical protein [Kitasatospora terrestris]|uniref:Uncharacterized protein n=1 Tax=Kitasatospora terrestris TaxID=258051 RepID=A0ABP9EFY3_9ACTN
MAVERLEQAIRPVGRFSGLPRCSTTRASRTSPGSPGHHDERQRSGHCFREIPGAAPGRDDVMPAGRCALLDQFALDEVLPAAIALPCTHPARPPTFWDGLRARGPIGPGVPNPSSR